MKIPDPFGRGRFFEINTKIPLKHKTEEGCPICNHIRACITREIMSASQTLPPVPTLDESEPTGFEVSEK